MADKFQTGGEHTPGSNPDGTPNGAITALPLNAAEVGTNTHCPLDDKGNISNKA